MHSGRLAPLPLEVSPCDNARCQMAAEGAATPQQQEDCARGARGSMLGRAPGQFREYIQAQQTLPHLARQQFYHNHPCRHDSTGSHDHAFAYARAGVFRCSAAVLSLHVIAGTQGGAACANTTCHCRGRCRIAHMSMLCLWRPQCQHTGQVRHASGP